MMTQELDLEDPLAIVTRFNADDGIALIADLTDDEAQTLVDHLKAGADKYWAINPNRSLEMADTIIKIAVGRNNLSHKALGIMAHGDALKLLGNSQEAWDELGEAGEIFLRLGDEVGWARTRIGRIALCLSLNHVTQAFSEGEQARTIFTRHYANKFLVRLDLNIALILYYLGDYKQALEKYRSILSIINTPSSSERQFLGLIFINLGNLYYDFMGDIQAASEYYQKALSVAVIHNDVKNIALTKHNMAFIAMGQGQYLHALQLFYQACELYEFEQLTFDANHVKCEIIECYLILNRYPEARELAIQVIDKYLNSKANYDKARVLLHLATIEADRKDFNASQEALNDAEAVFRKLGARTWVATTTLKRGFLLLKQDNIESARSIVETVIQFFKNMGQDVNLGTAMLLKAQCQFALGDLEEARQSGSVVLEIAHNVNAPLLRYSMHLLLGYIAEIQRDLVHAERRYYAAFATIERVQNSLTITLRPGFLEDKNDAFKALIALYLRIDNAISAFNLLERAKSHVFFNYIANRHLLRWPHDDPKCQALTQELDQLRGEHHWWYQKAYIEAKDEHVNEDTVSFDDVLKELAKRERRMHAITEQLYLQSSATNILLPSSTPRLQDIQSSLDEKTLLIEFYHDNNSVWIFTIDSTTCNVQRSSASVSTIERDLNFLHFNIDTTLSPNANIAQISSLTNQAKILLQHLYEQLLAPIASRLHGYQRLVFVPFGFLHFVPFHLLFTEAAYLIEHHEIVVLPAASYATRIGPSRTGGARVIAHSLHGALLHALDEADFVHNLFGGTVCVEDNASRVALQEAPSQILHIATHSEYRQQQPDLSYIELADGQLFTDDLFQQDMSYELVTLSACETGRSQVASSDELIGLGRGFLYAGAGALVASLWRVVDEVTPRLMEHFYRELYAGAPKAAALRFAQLAILSENPQMHPAFWGAFQLVGDPRPLSSNPSTKNPQ